MNTGLLPLKAIRVQLGLWLSLVSIGFGILALFAFVMAFLALSYLYTLAAIFCLVGSLALACVSQWLFHLSDRLFKGAVQWSTSESGIHISLMFATLGLIYGAGSF